MAAWLADLVTSSGSVLATDLDVSGLAGLHRANVTAWASAPANNYCPPAASLESPGAPETLVGLLACPLTTVGTRRETEVVA